MSLHTEACRACHGDGKLEYEEERWFDGTWRRRTGGSDSSWPSFCAARPDLARYTSDSCEVCDGSGSYVLESVACRIL